LLYLSLNMAIPTGVRWNLSVVLICITFIARKIWTLLRVFIDYLFLW
jgi:hypothetical protein